MKRPDVSIVASAFRPANWQAFYDSIGENDAQYEVIFVGPNLPQHLLPSNFRLLQSMVKPAQCFEIGFRESTAELVMYVADDMTFRTAHPIDRLMIIHRQNGDKRLMTSCLYMKDGIDRREEQRFFIGEQTSPLMPMCALMDSEYLKSIGGIDRNFIATMWDCDLAMRFLTAGGGVVLSDVSINEDKSKSFGSTLCQEFWSHDRALLMKLWASGGKIVERQAPVESFGREGLFIESQGPKARWL